MATAFIQTSLFSKSYVLTSEARSIAASTDEAKLNVSLAYSGETFFSVELYAYDGNVELFDPGSIVEDFFRSRDMITGAVTVTFGTLSKTLTFLYCEYEMPDGFNPKKALLLSSSARRVHAGSWVNFAALPESDRTKIDLRAVGPDSTGLPVTATTSFTANASEVSSHNYIIDINTCINGFIAKNPEMTRVLYFSISNGERQLMCYLSPSRAFLHFIFRNIYNEKEYIDVEGAMVTKSETSRQSARCSGDILQYDRRTDRTYQFSTGPLPADEVESLNQLVASYSVQLYADGTYHDIVIDDHTCEDSTEDDSLTVVKFTWRFKGRRPVRFSSDLFGIRPSDSHIFSDQFTPEYE